MDHKPESDELMSQIATTQNIMKNKFNTAYANRLEREHNLNEVIKPLTELSTTTTPTINDSDALAGDNSLRNLSKNATQQLRLATKSYPNRSINSRPMSITRNDDSVNAEIDPNELCSSLRFLLSSQILGTADHTAEINDIITKLRELKVIV